MLVVMVVADRGLRFENMRVADVVRFIFFPLGLVVGTIFGWTRPLLGGIIAGFSAVMYFTLAMIQSGNIPVGETYFVFPIPGFLFLIKGIIDAGLNRAKKE